MPPMRAHGHGHSHAGSMNMRALVLHVLGDALGNVGVIATGLILLLAPPLWIVERPGVRSASFVLHQGVPATISLEQVRAAILAVEGVQSLHELHIWQASLILRSSSSFCPRPRPHHLALPLSLSLSLPLSLTLPSPNRKNHRLRVLAARELDFMPIAPQIRRALHDQGIHPCTIQPEYYGTRASSTRLRRRLGRMVVGMGPGLYAASDGLHHIDPAHVDYAAPLTPDPDPHIWRPLLFMRRGSVLAASGEIGVSATREDVLGAEMGEVVTGVMGRVSVGRVW
ncbi:hypothetical protein C8F04DRAFT_1270144 [Mycena alexandri]|uniref:Uncharacterized protein n=1 Tax=Mycena alexandri TaxID=1745969 RepID=A0AAD6SB43_9AGAR|nr:hypothetical protein C8F04DRAFT_1270144 [Mycena alexandri]